MESSEKVPRRWKILVQRQVRFNSVPKKVPEKVWEAQVNFNRIYGPFKTQNPAKIFPALSFAARFKKNYTRRRMARERRGAESSIVNIRHYIIRQYIKHVL